MINRAKHNIIISILLLYCCGIKAQTTTYTPFYESQKESYVKSMKSVFEDIHNRKWLKAEKDYDKVIEKSNLAKIKYPTYTNTQYQALYPLPQLALAILYSTDYSGLEATQKPTLQLNYMKAYSLLKYALTYPEKSKLNAFLSDPNVNVNLNILEDRIEDALCKEATTANTEKAYDSVIDSLLPQSLRLQSMKMQRADLVYNNIMKSPSESECQRFLKKYTDARIAYRTAIAHSLDSIHYNSLDGSIESLKKYIKMYPNSSLIAEAKDTLESLEFQAIKPIAASCRSYLDRYPTAKHTMQVKKLYTELAYKEAIASGTAEAYLAYCKDFPYDLRYQNVFDSLLYRTIDCIYDTVFAGKEPNKAKYLSAAFMENMNNRAATVEQLKEKGLVPPKMRNIWVGILLPDDSIVCPFNHLEISDIDLKSKKTATVHILLTKQHQEETSPTPSNLQSDIYLDFIFEGKALKIDDIRLDNGKTSMKNGGM